MSGTIPASTDSDWFQFTLDAESYVTVRAPFIPVASGFHIALYNEKNMNVALASTTEVAERSDQGSEIFGIRLPKGKYFVRMSSIVPFKYDSYKLTLSPQPLISGDRKSVV